MKYKNLLFPTLLLTGFMTASQAAVTYVDATKANTSVEGGGSWVSGTDYTEGNGGGVGSDDKWHFRTPLTASNGENAWVAQGGTSTETPDRLVTTITLTDPGQYYIYGFFWVGDFGAAAWDAGFELGNSKGATAGNVQYTNANAISIVDIPAASTYFTDDSVMYDAEGGKAELFQASLGIWDTAEDGFEVKVIVDGGLDSIPDVDNRTRYDGIGYQVIPEPATYALLGGLMALTSVALRRRRGV